MNIAKKSTENKLLVVEGYMDVISLHQAGIDFAVASLGTALTNMQGRILRKYADEIVISYDSDTAGQRATERGLEILVQLGCRVKVLQTPDGKILTNILGEMGEKFKNLIDRALSLLEYKISLLKKCIPQDNQKGTCFLKWVADLLSEQDNFLERNSY